MDNINIDVNNIIDNYEDLNNINNEMNNNLDINTNSAESILLILNSFINNFEQFKSYDNNFKEIFNKYLPVVSSMSQNILSKIVTDYSDKNYNALIENVINIVCELQNVKSSKDCIDLLIKLLNKFSSVETINMFIKNEKYSKIIYSIISLTSIVVTFVNSYSNVGMHINKINYTQEKNVLSLDKKNNCNEIISNNKLGTRKLKNIKLENRRKKSNEKTMKRKENQIGGKQKKPQNPKKPENTNRKKEKTKKSERKNPKVNGKKININLLDNKRLNKNLNEIINHYKLKNYVNLTKKKTKK